MPHQTHFASPGLSPGDGGNVSRTPDPGSRWEFALDAAAVIAFVTEFTTAASTGVFGGLTLAGLLLAAAGMRRRYPVMAALSALLASAVVMLAPGTSIPVWVIAQVCIFSLALRKEGPLSVALPVLHGLTLYVAGLTVLGLAPLDPALFSLPVWTAAAASAGYALRSQKATIFALQEMVRASAAAKDSEIRRTLGEERIRIARDLHDAVAHNIAVINVHAGAAEKALATDRTRAEESLEQVRSASRTVLREMQDILLVLRSPGQPDDMGPLPSVEGIPALLDTGRDLGLVIDARVENLSGLDAAVEAAVYRVVQEALTNAHRHGSGRATVILEATQNSVVLTVTNPISPRRNSEGGGHGLIGMRERVESAGGQLRLAEAAGEFTVHVILPVQSQRLP